MKCSQRNSILKEISVETDKVKINSLQIKYKALRNEITKEKRDGKKAYFTAYFEKNKKKSSEVWKGIRSLVNIKQTKTNLFKLKIQDQLISDPKKVANTFNMHFSTLGSNVQKKIPVEAGSFKDFLTKRNKDGKLHINPNGHTFFLGPTVPEEVFFIINSLNQSKSSGPNGIPVFIIKEFINFFSVWLSYLVNLSFETGVFPDLMKVASVIPLHKKGSKLDFLNYRPISLLSIFSKIYEKLITDRVNSYLEKYALIYAKQFGFRKNHSTNHAIISLTENIRKLLDNGHYVCGIFVDLEKAFDTVSHEILCQKLEYYGIRGKENKLFQSYLCDRKQYVSINGAKSEVSNVTCGVPQGSSLGPLLFLIYINDFRVCLNETSAGHFADDTFILYNSKKAKTLETIINTELKQVVKWLNLNKLSLNADKTELIFFHSKQHVLDYEKVSIKFNGVKLKAVDYVKYLGVFIDKYLSWDFHICELSKKLSKANGIISKLRYNTSRKNCLMVYNAIFHSHLITACNAWGLTTEENISKIEVLQKKCMRILNFAPFNAHTNQLFIDLQVIKVRDLIKSYQLRFVFDHFLNKLPIDFQNFFSPT